MAHRTEIDKEKLDYAYQPGTVGVDWIGVFIPTGEPFDIRFRGSRDSEAWTPHGRSAKTFHVIDGVRFMLSTPPTAYGTRRVHRLEFLRAGMLNEGVIINTLSKVVTTNPLDLRMARFDATADIANRITMGHVRASLRIQRKQKSKEYFGVATGTHRFETMYFGETTSDSFVRVYDKARQLESVNLPCSEDHWVRLERVFQGRAIPDRMKTLGAFFQNGATFTPFDPVQIFPFPDPEKVDPTLVLNWRPSTPNDRRNALYTLTLVRALGRTRAGRILREEGRNAKNALLLMDRMIGDLALPLPSTPDLNGLYQDAFKRQMFGQDNKSATGVESPRRVA